MTIKLDDKIEKLLLNRTVRHPNRHNFMELCCKVGQCVDDYKIKNKKTWGSFKYFKEQTEDEYSFSEPWYNQIINIYGLLEEVELLEYAIKNDWSSEDAKAFRTIYYEGKIKEAKMARPKIPSNDYLARKEAIKERILDELLNAESSKPVTTAKAIKKGSV